MIALRSFPIPGWSPGNRPGRNVFQNLFRNNEDGYLLIVCTDHTNNLIILASLSLIPLTPAAVRPIDYFGETDGKTCADRQRMSCCLLVKLAAKAAYLLPGY
ncbi:MAG: hypothetical protein U0T82_03370 [Bacteroidales bacterium]